MFISTCNAESFLLINRVIFFIRRLLPVPASVLVMLADQYHPDNFIQRASVTTALVLKTGKGKQRFRQYLIDALYYTGCYQLGFAASYYPFKWRN